MILFWLIVPVLMWAIWCLVAKVEKRIDDYAALKVREATDGKCLLPKQLCQDLRNAVAGTDPTITSDAALLAQPVKLREELARVKWMNSENLKARQFAEEEARELREERDALKAENQLAWNTCDEAETKLSRAESALAEARDKALDEAATIAKYEATGWQYSDINGECAVEIATANIAAALLALKEKRS